MVDMAVRRAALAWAGSMYLADAHLKWRMVHIIGVGGV